MAGLTFTVSPTAPANMTSLNLGIGVVVLLFFIFMT
jgi:hypothetical protein